MSYVWYGRGYGRGLGLGLGPNLSPYCRWYPGMPRGWWANPAYASQTAAQPAPIMSQPNYGTRTHQYSPQTMTTSSSPPQKPQSTMPPQQPYYSPQMQYGFGAGRGMGMRYRRGIGHFSGGVYQY